MTSSPKTAALILSAAVFLSACTQRDPDRLLDEAGNPIPAGAFAEGVDGLEVGHRLMAAGEFEVALKSYTRAAIDRGFDAEVLSAIGSANMRLGRLNQAEKILRLAIDKDDRSVPAWNNLGVVLTSRGEFGEAREAFRVAFALDNGASDEIGHNLRLLDRRLENLAPPQEDDAEFRLVRRGNGRYLLLGNEQ